MAWKHCPVKREYNSWSLTTNNSWLHTIGVFHNPIVTKATQADYPD